MPRAKLPTPLVSVQTIGDARPLGAGLPELWRIYLESGDARQLSRSRMYSLKRTCELSRSLPAFPDKGHITQWLTNLSSGRAGSTVRLHFWDLLSLYNWAHGNNFAGYNPMTRLKWKVPEPQRHAVWDIHEKWPAILATATEPRERAFIGVCRFAGLREGEALGLYPEDFEQRPGAWLMRVRRQRSQHTLDTSTKLKTITSRRPVEVHPVLRGLLQPVMSPASAKVGRGGGATVATPLLFPFRTGDLKRMMARIRVLFPDDFEVGDAWHVFRHSFAVECYRWGRDVVTISTVLGHKSIAYTQKYLRGFIGREPTKGFFDGMDGAPPWQAPAAPAAPAVQAPLMLGPLNAVSPTKRGGAPPGEKRAAASVTAPAAAQSRSSNPSDLVQPTEQNPRHTTKAVSQ